jgi:hypothetical protein
MVKIFTGTLYSCPCGYETLSAAGSLAHSKTKKCIQHVMVKTMTEFVTKSEYDNKGSDASAVSIEGDNNVAINGDNNDNSVNINFVLPEKTTKEDFMEYLLAMDHLGFRTPEQVAAMPGKLLMFTRGAKELPGAIIERNKKIIEKLPDGTERIMGKKKAIQTYTHEAVDALCWRPPAHGVSDFLETERGDKRTKVSIQDAAKLRVTNPRGYHHGVPDDVKFRHQKIESHTEKALDKITTDNKLDGFL